MRRKTALAIAGCAAGVELVLFHLGRTYGSTCEERSRSLPGDDVVLRPDVVTDHAITINASPNQVWPWLVQMGWHRGGWYTARWVDQLLFPANWASADEIVPELQSLAVGSFIPDGPPESGCGFMVDTLEPERHLVLRSTSHLPPTWREREIAGLDWTWTFVLTPLDHCSSTRFHFRSRWRTSPWWFTAGGNCWWCLLISLWPATCSAGSKRVPKDLKGPVSDASKSHYRDEQSPSLPGTHR